MHARLTRFEGAPDRIDDAVRQTEEVFVPRLREIEGFGGIVSLADRSTGTVVAITYWESEEAMRASHEKVTEVRKDAADAEPSDRSRSSSILRSSSRAPSDATERSATGRCRGKRARRSGVDDALRFAFLLEDQLASDHVPEGGTGVAVSVSYDETRP